MSRKRVVLKPPLMSNAPKFELPAETEVELARILRRAAGLEDLPDPTERKPDGMLWVMYYVWSIFSVIPYQSIPKKRPREVVRELEKLQLDLGEIRRRIEKIDDFWGSWLNRFGSPNYRALHRMDDGGGFIEDIDRGNRLLDALEAEPPETWTVPAAVAAIRRLDRAIPEVIDLAEGHAGPVPTTGRNKNETAHAIAQTVADYVRDVTGELPGPRLRYTGSDFERTLKEIFKLLKIDADAQAPAKAALLKLGKDG